MAIKTCRRSPGNAQASSPKKCLCRQAVKNRTRTRSQRIARGPAPHPPANIQPPQSPAMGIGTRFNSIAKSTRISSLPPPTSHIDEELKEAASLRALNGYGTGADTVMDLSTGGDIPTIRKPIDASPVPVAPSLVLKRFPASAAEISPWS